MTDEEHSTSGRFFQSFRAMLLPVVVRELQVRSRAPGTHYVRMAAVAALALLWAMLFEAFSRPGAAATSGRMGLEFLSSFLLMYVLVEGVRNSAGGICEERREGTLGLLFLTDLSGLDVLLGKVSGAAIQAFYGLVAVVPVLGVALLFGGVSGAELVRMVAGLLAVLALSLACGSWSSARAREGMGSMLLAMGVLLSACLVPLLLDALMTLSVGGTLLFPRHSILGLASPLNTVALVADPPAGSGTAPFWISIALVVGQSMLWILMAGQRLQRSWRAEALGAGTPERVRQVARFERRRVGEDLLGRTVSRHLNLTRWSRRLILLTLLLSAGSAGMRFVLTALPSVGPLFQLPLGLMALTRMLLLVWQATRAFGDWRHGGELEILLTTTVSEGELVLRVWNQFRGVLVRIILVDVVTSGVITGWTVASSTSVSPIPFLQEWSLVIHWAGGILAEIAQFWALIWVGFWMGLCSRNLGIAIGKTFGIVAIGGYFVAIIFQVGLINWFSASSWSPGQGKFLVSMLSFALMQGVFSLFWVHWAKLRMLSGLRASLGAVS